MKKCYFLAALFFTLAVFAGAQDMIVLVNGNMIEAKVEEISTTEIKYRRFDNLRGPLIIINKSEVFSIRYENGAVEVINSPGQQSAKPTAPALDPNKLYFSFSFEPSGLIAGGPSATGEFTKGSRITSFHVSFPTLALNSTAKGFGFGAGAGLDYYWGRRIGGFFLGGLFEWNMYPYLITVWSPYGTYNAATDSYSGKSVSEEAKAHNFILALDGGYKFITSSGAYFRAGVAAGVQLSMYSPLGFYYKPVVAAGYIFK